MNRQQKGEAYRAALTAAADSLARSRINSTDWQRPLGGNLEDELDMKVEVNVKCEADAGTSTALAV